MVQYFMNDKSHLRIDLAQCGSLGPFRLHSFNSSRTVSGVVGNPVRRLT